MPHPFLDLLESGSVPLSRVSGAAQALLNPLRETGAITRDRSGGGWKLVLHNREALRAVLASQAPGFLEEVDPSLGPKGQAVARSRDAHAAKGGDADLVLLKARPGIHLKGPEGQHLDAGELTRSAGALAVVLDDRLGWSIDGAGSVALVTVENCECFLRAENLGVQTDVWIYTQGRLTKRVLSWLHVLAQAGGTLTHFGDYDPVGIDEYRRLHEGWGDRVRLHIPGNLEALFKSRSNRKIMAKERNQDVFGRLVAMGGSLPEDAREVLRLIQAYGAGLEQEAVPH